MDLDSEAEGDRDALPDADGLNDLDSDGDALIEAEPDALGEREGEDE